MTDTKIWKPNAYDISAWIITVIGLWLVFHLHLLPALLSGLLVYELVHISAPLLRISKLSDSRARLVVVAVLAFFIISLLITLVWWGVHFFRSDTVSLPALLQRMADIMEKNRAQLPEWATQSLPGDADGLRREAAQWLREHSSTLKSAGRDAGRTLAHLLVGMVLGAIIAVKAATPRSGCTPFVCSLTERVERLSESFRSVVFAQVRISAFNTLLTFLYLAVGLPLFGVHLPLVKTMIIICFVAGLLPIIGNLISNAIIIVISLSNSVSVSIASLIFLLLMHKSEYFLNAHIIGHRIHAQIWELLLAMLIMESAFGISGVIAAPVYYAFVKKELTDKGLV